MRSLVLVFLFVFFAKSECNSQSREFILPAFTLLDEVNWRDSVYLYPQFQKGEMIFDTGFSPPKKLILNLNLFTERIDAISLVGDTLTLRRFNVKHLVKIGKDTFHFDPQKGYLKIIVPGVVSLANLNYLSSGFIVNKKRYMLKEDKRTEEFNLDRFYVKQTQPYLITEHKIYTVDKINLVKAYPQNKGVVKLYLRNHKIDYKNQDQLAACVTHFNGLGHVPEAKTPGMFRVKAEDDIAREWKDSVYQFPSFKTAVVKYKDGSDQSVQMNYNFYTGNMDFLNGAGDTLQFYSDQIRLIHFANQLFYKHPTGAYAVVIAQGAQALCEIKRLKLIQRELNPDSPPQYSKPFSSEDQSLDRLYIMETTYQFLDKALKWRKASKESYISFFPGRRKQIITYLNNNPVNFKSKDDLLRLLSFCNQL